MYRSDDTIVAQCTAPGAGALALIRLSGPRACAYAAAASSCPQTLRESRSHTIRYGHVVRSDGQFIDQVMFLVMHAPKTFTGQETVEITCHNNVFIIHAIIARLCEIGARPAAPGEFTQRAVLHGKMDMIQAEALHELITAPSEAIARASLAQLEGSLSREMAVIEEQLVMLAAHIEAHFEFSEEEHLDLDFNRIISERFEQVLSQFSSILIGASAVQQLKEGVRIALIGSVNAGKSTLLNALTGRDRAIVSDRAGTTRDSIEVGMSSGPYAWTFIDTAGLRQTDDLIEKEGIVRSYRAADAADIVLLIVDGSVTFSAVLADEYRELVRRYSSKLVPVVTKAIDQHYGGSSATFFPFLPESLSCGVCFVNVHEGRGVDELRATIIKYVQACYHQVTAPFVLNRRQISLLEAAQRGVRELYSDVKKGCVAHEISALRVQEIIASLSEFSGRAVSEQVMNTVFSMFCIGK